MSQLILNLELRPALGRGDFVVGAPNQSAVAFIDRWPDWPAKAAAIFGPEGSGKSHLTEVWRAASDAAVFSSMELNVEKLAALVSSQPVAVEDVDRDVSETRDRALMALFERPEGVLLLSGRTPPSTWQVTIPDLKSRFDALVAFPLWAPDDALLLALAKKLFADRQLKVPDAVLTRMVHSLDRLPAAIRDFIAKADAKALAEKRPITERLVTELLDASAG